VCGLKRKVYTEKIPSDGYGLSKGMKRKYSIGLLVNTLSMY
jgi:hypothetical protein